MSPGRHTHTDANTPQAAGALSPGQKGQNSSVAVLGDPPEVTLNPGWDDAEHWAVAAPRAG